MDDKHRFHARIEKLQNRIENRENNILFSKSFEHKPVCIGLSIGFADKPAGYFAYHLLLKMILKWRKFFHGHLLIVYNNILHK
jgi:hypothetical protein